MKGFFKALNFLTIFPFGKKYQQDGIDASCLIFFPIAGLAIGLLLLCLLTLLYTLGMRSPACDIVVVVTLVLMTGGLHIEGLSDMADAFGSGKDRNSMLEIMRDPHVGPMGIIAVVCAILLKIALLSSFAHDAKAIAIIAMCVLSRWSLVLSLCVFPYARKEGKAKVFKEGSCEKQGAVTTFIAGIIIIGLSGFHGLSMFAMASLVAYLIGRVMERRLGGITGDTLGASCEMVEIAVLFAAFLI